jgi:hypothetical protein
MRLAPSTCCLAPACLISRPKPLPFAARAQPALDVGTTLSLPRSVREPSHPQRRELPPTVVPPPGQKISRFALSICEFPARKPAEEAFSAAPIRHHTTCRALLGRSQTTDRLTAFLRPAVLAA